MAVREIDWLELPDHLTVFMADKLSRSDFIRFSAVCKPWNSIYNAHSKHSLPHQLPLLLVPNTNEDLGHHMHNTHNFYEFHEKRMYCFKVSIPRFMDYNGSSHGCLVLVWNSNGGQNKEVYVRISYPFLTKHKDIDLPPLRGQNDIKKVVLSANPSSNYNYTVMAVINDRDRRLAFFKPTAGDKSDWTCINESSSKKIHDILYYNKNHQFYFVERSGMVFACDVNDPNDPKVLPILAPPSYSSFRQHDNNNRLSKYLYLVELSSGELLLIKKCMKHFITSKYELRSCVNGFSAYKMNPLVDPKWIEVQNLCGDTIFLGDYTSLSVQASEFCECRPNCIYFTDRHEWTDANHIGVFSLEERIIIERYPIEVRSRVRRSPIWMEPTLPG